MSGNIMTKTASLKAFCDTVAGSAEEHPVSYLLSNCVDEISEGKPDYIGVNAAGGHLRRQK